MRKILYLLILLTLTGCVKNEDFEKTCTSSVKSENLREKTSIYVKYNSKDTVKQAVVTKTYKALNYNGEDILKDIKENSSAFNIKYDDIKIVISKDESKIYELKYYLDVPNLKESTLDDFNLKKNSIKFFNKMKTKDIECK